MNPTENVQLSSPNWPNVTFAAEAEHEEFATANIITLRAHYREQVYEKAFDRAAAEGVTVDKVFSIVEDYAIEIMEAGTITVREFVFITEDLITICINEERINDETTFRALDRLVEVEELAPGRYYDFGPAVSFQPHEVKFRDETID